MIHSPKPQIPRPQLFYSSPQLLRPMFLFKSMSVMGGANDGPSEPSEILVLPAPENSTKNSISKNSKNSNSKPNRQNNNGNRDEGRTNPHFRYPNSQPHCLTPTPTQDDEKTSKPKISVKFSDKPIKINRELSQTRGPKTK